MDNPLNLDDSNFDKEVTQSAQPVLVDFWAEWCGPCKMIAPLIDEIAKEKAGSVKVAKVNVDENQSLSMKYNVRAIPALLFFKKGRGLNETFTVRRISYGEGVERVFPVHSPRIAKVEVEKEGRARRAKLNYLRTRKGKEATAVRE